MMRGPVTTAMAVRNPQGEIVLEKVFKYITLSSFEIENSVSVGLEDTENSDSKSSSII